MVGLPCDFCVQSVAFSFCLFYHEVGMVCGCVTGGLDKVVLVFGFFQYCFFFVYVCVFVHYYAGVGHLSGV